MKRLPIRTIQCGQRWMVASFAVAMLMSTVSTTRALPVFPMPDPFGGHPAFGVNLAPTGPGLLAPGGALGPLLFFDGIASPDVGHWELEINNPNPFPIVFDITLVFPGGPVSGSLFLPPGSSGYFDLGYIDAASEVGPWSLSAAADPAAPIGGGISIDTDVIETAGPTHPPGLALFASAGPGGAGAFGAPVGGPGVTLTLEVVPEPGSLALLAAGLVGLLGYARLRKKKLP